LGYVGKLAVEGWFQWRRARAAQLGRLLELASLLHASREAFIAQRRLVERLEKSLTQNHPNVVQDRSGFERHFAQTFTQFTPDEAELHGLIRSMTQHTLRPLNQAISDWLWSDLTYRTARGADANRGKLATKLNQLDTHLRLWHAKYEAWIPEYPQHALIYLADEEEHGIGFPVGLDGVVDQVLRDADAKMAPNPLVTSKVSPE
jgi:hypothetical protein